MPTEPNSTQTEQHLYCAMPKVPERIFSPTVSTLRASVILSNSTKWANGTILKYYFFRTENATWKGTASQENVVRNAFDVWKNVGIGVSFQEVNIPEEADIRIGFLMGDGSWSYVGRDILLQPKSDRTMNFGWDISSQPREIDTAIHEIGHSLGLQHEHQNPNAGIVWNEEAVYNSLGGSPNFWGRDMVFNNILKKINPSEVQGSNFDANSVMEYPFEGGLILQPEQFRNGLNPAGGLSAKDKEVVRGLYPPLTNADYTGLNRFDLKELTVPEGEQQNFSFKPKFSAKYKIQTTGTMDTVMVLFEVSRNGDENFLAGDDDSGTDANSFIQLRLIKGRKYLIRVRILHKGNGSGGITIS